MLQKIKTLIDLTNESTDLFLDSCVVSREHASWYTREMYDRKGFLHLNEKPLEDVAKSVSDISMILSENKVEVYVPQKVICEMQKFREILKKKFKLMEEHTHLAPHSNNTLRRKKGVFWQIIENYRTLQRLAEFHQFSPNHEDFDIFENIENEIVKIGIQTGAKIKTKVYWDNSLAAKEVGGNNTSSNQEEDLRTDEQIIASAVYNCVMRNRPGNVVTSDSDLGKLLNATVANFSGRQDLKDSYRHLLKYPVKVYYTLANRGLDLIANSSEAKINL